MKRAHLEHGLLSPDALDAAWVAADAAAEQAEALMSQPPPDALRAMVRLFGERGVLRFITDDAHGGRFPSLRVEALCVARERLGYAAPLCDLAFAMQGLGSYPMTLASTEVGASWIRRIVAGDAVAGFALTEPGAGTDLGGLSTQARREGDSYVLNGEKTYISNAGVADVYTLFAATAPASTARRISAFVVPADAPGLVATAQPVLGGHPLGALRLDRVRVPLNHRLGAEGDGMRLALGTLSRFRPTVGAAAVGFAQRALDETLAHVKTRHQFGAPLADLPLVQARLADMACAVEASRLLVYRAAAAIDAGADRDRVAYLGSMAKLVATESAQSVVDHAVQLHGGRGVLKESIVAQLYEDVRSLRIYEGTTDVQKVLIARELLGT